MISLWSVPIYYPCKSCDFFREVLLIGNIMWPWPSFITLVFVYLCRIQTFSMQHAALTKQIPLRACVCVCMSINNTCSLGWINTPVCLGRGVPCRWWCTAALLQLVATGPYFIRCYKTLHSYALQVSVIIWCYLAGYRLYDKQLCSKSPPLGRKC